MVFRYLRGVLNPLGIILSVAVVCVMTWGLDAFVGASSFTDMLSLPILIYLFMLLFQTNISFAAENKKKGFMKMNMNSELGQICTELNAEAHGISNQVPKNIKFYTEPNDATLNACCFGSRKVCVSKGFADNLLPSKFETEEEKANIEEAAKGVLSHEFGHIANGDMIGEHICTAAMATFAFALYAVYLALYFVVWMFSHAPIFNVLAVPVSWLLKEIYYLASWITGLGYKLFHIINGKREETAADAFAVRLGHKAGLMNFLENYCLKNFGEGKVLDEHPLTSKRIAALQKLPD